MARRVLAAAVFLTAVGVLAQAAILTRLSDAELVQHSATIIEGTITDVTPSWQDPDGDGISQIWTTVKVRADRVLKGDLRPGDTVTFLQLGGKIGAMELRIAGMPQFAEGDRELLFLMKNLNNPKYTAVTGFSQGRWKIRRAQDGTDLAHRDFSDSCFYRLDKNVPVEDVKPSEAEEALSDVVARFQQEISAQSAAGVAGEVG